MAAIIKNATRGGSPRSSFANFDKSAEQSHSGVMAGLGQLQDLGADYLRDSNLTVEERFGESLNAVRDRTAEELGANRRAIARAVMLSGDLPGTGVVAANSLQEASNRGVGDTEISFGLRNEAANEASRDRYGNVIADTVTAEMNNRNFFQDEANRKEMLRIQKEQAKKQRRSGILGGLLSAGATVMSGPIGGMVGKWVGDKLGKEVGV